jgi:hypothetical protein
MPWTNCIVNGVQAATDGTEIGAGSPQAYVILTDVNSPPAFTNTNFFLAAPGQNQMLAIAIAAMNLNFQVGVGYTAPNPNNNPYTAITRLLLTSSAT